MFSTAAILDNLKQDESVEYKKLCRLLKLSKKIDKDKLHIALTALEKLEIIKKIDNEYLNVKDNNHIIAKIRCSSKGYCFAIRDNTKEDIYIKENLLNNAWNGDKVLVRITKEGIKRRSPEGIVDCILERSNQILLAKVEVINNEVYGIPIDDRILAKIKLPKDDEKYKFISENKNIVKIEIDIFPIAQLEGRGHVIKELKLNINEKEDIEFVLSKSNINKIENLQEQPLKKTTKNERLDLSDKNAYMFKSWSGENSPILPLIHVEKNKDKTSNLWIHSNSISEKLDLFNKKVLETYLERFESFPLLDKWQNYLSKNITTISEFKVGKKNDAISICITLNNNNEIINWSFHLTSVKCSLIVDNKHLEALLNRKSKTRITSRTLKPIKEYIEEIDNIIEISEIFRNKQLSKGKIEIPKITNSIESLSELFVHNPVDYSSEYIEPLNKLDIQTYLSPLLYEADLIWFKHSIKYNIKNIYYVSQDLDYINVSEIITNSELIDSKIELNEKGTLSFKELIKLCNDENKKRILDKIITNVIKTNEIELTNNDSNIDKENHIYISPWTLPSFDFANLMNQYNIYNMIVNARKSNKGNSKLINIMEKDSWDEVNWELFNSNERKNIDLIFNKYTINKINEFKRKARQYRVNMINIKQVREAEKRIGNIYNGLIMSVQSYGFFVEIPELYVEGLVHVSTLNNDWYEYRSRQNILVGRKSKRAFKIGDSIKIKIIKVDILKYQIDLELV